jgi:hypothetical protein
MLDLQEKIMKRVVCLFILLLGATHAELIASPLDQLQQLSISLDYLTTAHASPKPTASPDDMFAELKKQAQAREQKKKAAEDEARRQKELEDQEIRERLKQEEEKKLAAQMASNIPLDQVLQQIATYPNAQAQLKFLSPISTDTNLKLSKEAAVSAQNIVENIKKNSEKIKQQQDKTTFEQALTNNIITLTRLTSLAQPVPSYKTLIDKLIQLNDLLNTIASLEPKDIKSFVQSIKKLQDDIKIDLTSIERESKSALTKGQIKSIVSGSILPELDKIFATPKSTGEYIKQKQNIEQTARINYAQEINKQFINKLIELIQSYALSNNQTTKNYSFTDDARRYADIKALLAQVAQLPELSVLVATASNIIIKIKDIRDTEIKKLEELYALYNLELEHVKTQRSIPVQLDRIRTEIAKTKLMLEQKLRALPALKDIPELAQAIARIQQELPGIYLEIKPYSAQQETANAQEKQAEDILNFLILFYLDPTGALNSAQAQFMNTTAKDEALNLFQENLNQARLQLQNMYKIWQTKLQNITATSKTDNILHEDFIELLIEDPEQLKQIRDINRLLINNYDILKQQFTRNIKAEFNQLLGQVPNTSRIPIKLNYKVWQDKLNKQFPG